MKARHVAGFIVGVLALGCSAPNNAAGKLAQPPAFDPEGQTTCKVKKSQERPLIVEWPSADRVQLESAASDSVAVVSYSGCEMTVLPHCKAPGQYAYRPVTAKRERVTIRNADDLWAAIPMGAARFEGKLSEAGELNVSMNMVGHFAAPTPGVQREQLTGICDGATHVVAGLTVGAFEFFAGSESEVGGGGTVLGAGAGAKSASRRELLTTDGSMAACGAASATDSKPPEGCGALLRLEVVALQATGDSKAAPTGPRTIAGPTTPELALQRLLELAEVGKWEDFEAAMIVPKDRYDKVKELQGASYEEYVSRSRDKFSWFVRKAFRSPQIVKTEKDVDWIEVTYTVNNENERVNFAWVDGRYYFWPYS
jgi:hypothetical protein